MSLPTNRPSRIHYTPQAVTYIASLFMTGMNRHEVAYEVRREYGRRWRISSLKDMEDRLFISPFGSRPNFAKLFEGKTPEQVQNALIRWLNEERTRRNRARERALRRLEDLAVAAANLARLSSANSKEAREKIRAATKERYEDPREHERHSREAKRRYNTPEMREGLRQLAIDEYKDPANRVKAGKLSKARWDNPIERKKMEEANRKTGRAKAERLRAAPLTPSQLERAKRLAKMRFLILQRIKQRPHLKDTLEQQWKRILETALKRVSPRENETFRVAVVSRANPRAQRASKKR